MPVIPTLRKTTVSKVSLGCRQSEFKNFSVSSRASGKLRYPYLYKIGVVVATLGLRSPIRGSFVGWMPTAY